MKYYLLVLFLFNTVIYGNNNNNFVFDSTNDRRLTNSTPQSEDKEDSENKGMDFSYTIIESDDLDEDDKEEDDKEEEDDDDEVTISNKEVKPVDLKDLEQKKEKKKKENESFLSFLKIQMKMNYRNLILFDNIPYQHSEGLELTTSIMGLELKNASAYIGEIGYRISHNNNLAQSLIISPLMINFNFKKWGEVLPLSVNIFKIYFFKKTIRGNNNKTINLFFEYISLSMSWRFFKDKDLSSNIFLGLSFGPDDIKSNPKRESMVFTIGISGDFLPIKIKF